MNMTDELKTRLLAAAAKIKAKGWRSAKIELGVSYLGIFDRSPSLYDPMITFTAVIHTSSPLNHVKGWTFDTMELAIAALEESADAMPSFADEEKRKVDVLAKLSPEELRLVRSVSLMS